MFMINTIARWLSVRLVEALETCRTRWFRVPSTSGALALLASLAFLLSCNQDETAFGPQDRAAFQSSVAGRVTDRNGKALSGALVTALPGGATTVSGPDGSFTLSGLTSGKYRIALAKDEYRDTVWLDSVRLGLSVVRDIGKQAMRYRYATVSGLVEDSTGSGLPMAGIAVENQTSNAMAASEGKFLLARVEPGRVRLFTAMQGVGYATLDTVLQPDDTLKGVRMRIHRRGGAVTGKVVGEDGKAVSGASVQAVGGVLKTTTGNDGSFRITEMPSEGRVVVEVVKGDLSTLVTGVQVEEGSQTSLDTIRIAAPVGPKSEVSVRTGLALGFTTDSVLTLVADTVSSDTSFRVLRYLWSLDNGATWDTTSVNVLVVRPERLGWTEGVYTVSVKVVAIDGRVSKAGTLTVRLVIPFDETPPAVERLQPGLQDSIVAWKDSVVVVAWEVTDANLASVWIAGERVTSTSKRYEREVTVPVGDTLITLEAKDAAGNTMRDSVHLTRIGKVNDYGIPWNDSIKYGSLKDLRDGKVYRTVTIGSQKWMAENLSVDVAGSWYAYGGDIDSAAKYGRLYTWAAMMALPDSCNNTSCATLIKPVHQGICPVGWHVPSEMEWDTLTNFVGKENAGMMLKAQFGWDSSGNGTDAVGFRALPAGARDNNGNFNYIGKDALFWLAAEGDARDSWYRDLYFKYAYVLRSYNNKTYGYPLRCVEGALVVDTSTALDSLSVDQGALTPAFASDILAYTDSVSSTVQSLKVLAKPHSAKAKITYNDSANNVVPITGNTTIKVKVTNGDSSRIYTINVVRKAVETAAAITLDPVAGTYASAQMVTLKSNAGEDIYYTLNGSEPTSASLKYTEPILVSASLTIKAVTARQGVLDSAVASSAYLITGTGLQTVGSMRLIPGATFQMGCALDSPYCAPDEKPVHTVTVSTFLIDTMETKGLGAGPSQLSSRAQTWLEAVSWCNQRSKREGLDTVYTNLVAGALKADGTASADFTKNGYRLPTEAEWEYAARAGTTTIYYWGNDSSKISDYAWYVGNAFTDSSQAYLNDYRAPGKKLPNRWGLYDMIGNAEEWVHDNYSRYTSQPQKDPVGPLVSEIDSGYFKYYVGHPDKKYAESKGHLTRGCNMWFSSWNATPTYRGGFWGLQSSGGVRMVRRPYTVEHTAAELPSPGSMKKIPAGNFTMGSPETELGRSSGETEHSVTLSAFYMDSTLVTQGQYTAVMGVNPSYFSTCGSTCPVENVSWFDAVLYCNARSKLDKLDTVYTYTSMTGTYGNGVTALVGIAANLSKSGYRLPTEAQWEYAARGGTTAAYYWGDNSSADTVSKYAWYSANSSSGTQPVATKPANPNGLYDMAGNVWQWTNDWYGTYATTEQTDPEGAPSGSNRVLRGGSWYYVASYLRSSYRSNGNPANRGNYNGFGFRSVRPGP
jgi:uncharacterized protein (TIGR02145 family)